MKILAIETSCDETAISILEATGEYKDAQFTVLGNALYSQAQKHAQYGGVYPTLAKREHAANLTILLEKAIKDASLYTEKDQDITDEQKKFIETTLEREPGLARTALQFLSKAEKPDIDAIAVTQGPGLEPALWVGINFARTLAFLWDLPILPVNHLEGHMIASSVEVSDENKQTYTITETNFPVLGLIISGGHTEFVYAQNWGDYKVIGATRDDSIGEAFDKVARLMGIPYPGGPELSRLAEQGRRTLLTRPAHLAKDMVTLPRPMANSDNLDFSFSGLKTAVLYYVQEKGDFTETQTKLLCAEFEEAVIDVLLKKVGRALESHQTNTLLLGGGVSANTYIRKRLTNTYKDKDVSVRLPAEGLSTDNAVMIGMAGYLMHLRKAKTKSAQDDLPADGNMKLDT